MQYFFDNHHHLWFFIAGLSFIVELSVMGLSGPLLFFAIGSLITGTLVSVGIISGWQAELLVVGILTAVIAVILWKPLKSFQNSKVSPDNSSDMIGLNVIASSDITATQGSIRYSGIDWQARLCDACPVANISSENQCQIVAISGNTLFVKPLI